MLRVLHEDNHLLIVNKPPGIATMGAPAGESSMVYEAKNYIRKKYDKPGNVYLGVVSRLDAPVSGVLLFARTSKAAARLTRQFQERLVEKTYWAMVPSGLLPDAGNCEDWLCHRDSRRRMVVCKEGSHGAVLAKLSYRTVSRATSIQHLEVNLETGRKHQIRAQLSARDCPILGDKKYGSDRRFGQGIALHARTLRLVHPVTKEPIEFTAPTPASWTRYLTEASPD